MLCGSVYGGFIMASAQVVLRGRFKPGSIVRLVRVAHEGVLRSEGGEEVATAEVDDSGEVKFSRGVDEGARYLVSGLIDGFPVEVRARGRASDDPAVVLEQPPVKPDRVRLSDGSWADEPPKRERTPDAFVARGPAQHQVRKGTVQRSDTPRGEAHPNDPLEMLPYPDQRTVKRGTVQMSDTDSGLATPVTDSPERQDQVPAGVWQRSATPLGVATVIPDVDGVEAIRERESSAAKAVRGQPVRAAADPPSARRGKRSKRATPSEVPPEGTPDAPPSELDDAFGQSAPEDVAVAAGAESGEPRVPDERSEEDRTQDVGRGKSHGTSVEGGKGTEAIRRRPRKK
jgi:hypothetical protein